MITLSIDVKQIDKDRLKPYTRKNGKEAMFLELILIPTPESEFGDYMVKQSVSKEERESGIQMPILGNAKQVVHAKVAAKEIRKQVEKTTDLDGEDIPF
jgi:hypothetical protein